MNPHPTADMPVSPDAEPAYLTVLRTHTDTTPPARLNRLWAQAASHDARTPEDRLSSQRADGLDR